MKRIPISQPYLTKIEEEKLLEAYRSGWISSIGPFVAEFEKRVAELSGVKHGISVSNGTTALHLALMSLGIGEGDEVIVPALTFVASANVVVHCGAKPVFVDIDEKSLCLDPEKIERSITKRTKAIMPVHLYGVPANMPEILKIADRHGLKVVEDAAEAFGARVGEKPIGSFGHCTVYSFYGNKIITTGEGGMIVTEDASVYEKACHIRDHAMSKTRRYWHDLVGYNYRITNLQAAIGVGQLENLGHILSSRAALLDRYFSNLEKDERLRLNRKPPGTRISPWFSCVEIPGITREKRDGLLERFSARGVDSRPYFYPLNWLPMYRTSEKFPVSEAISASGFNLPLYPNMTMEDVDYVCSVMKAELDADNSI